MPDAFYTSRRWLRLRDAVLRRDGYQCQWSKRYGKRVQAEVVHHVLPREQFPQYAYEPWNLISLSMAAHDKMHDRKTGELTDDGKVLARRVMRKNF